MRRDCFLFALWESYIIDLWHISGCYCYVATSTIFQSAVLSRLWQGSQRELLNSAAASHLLVAGQVCRFSGEASRGPFGENPGSPMGGSGHWIPRSQAQGLSPAGYWESSPCSSPKQRVPGDTIHTTGVYKSLRWPPGNGLLVYNYIGSSGRSEERLTDQ